MELTDEMVMRLYALISEEFEEMGRRPSAYSDDEIATNTLLMNWVILEVGARKLWS